MALTTRVSTVGLAANGRSIQYVLLPLSSGQPAQADLDLLAAQLDLGYRIVGFTAVDASNAHYTLEKIVV